MEIIIDTAGVQFDKNVHQAFKDGTPRRRKDGTFFFKKSKSRGKQSNVSEPQIAPKSDAEIELEKIVDDLPRESVAPSDGGAETAENAESVAEFDIDPDSEETAEKISCETIVALEETAAIMLFGADAAFESQDREALIIAWKKYAETNDLIELTPGTALLITHAVLSAKMAQKETIRAKFARIWRKIWRRKENG